jgi:HAD superfamily hydrolase (TIGR01509 family)
MDRVLPRTPRPFRLEAVLFDFDGTLTMPDALDFLAIRREVGCPPDQYVLEYIEALPAGERRDEALAALERFELEGAARARPNAGAVEVVRGLRRRGLKVGVITRNGRASIDRALTNFDDLDTADFDVIVTRDDPHPPKPAPDGVLGAAAAMGVDPARVLVVGDFILDALAGRAAGSVTAFLTNREPAGAGCPEAGACDFVIASLDELDGIVRLGAPLPQGKLPAELLAAHLTTVGPADPAVVIGAAIGEDVAALDISRDEILVAHSDPITLTTADPGRHAVIVNANDIATSGADPRWLLATVMLPAGSSAAEALHLLAGLSAACGELGVTLVGGHTEVTAAVAQPLVAGTMLGVLRRADLRDKRGTREGDRLILTKAIAIEGTALLATERGGRLTEAGMGDDELDRCRAFAGLLSVVPEASIAATFAGVRAMHDVTEGGLATALVELSVSCGREIAVERDAIPVYDETTRLCALLGADPLGLIGSGSLLICCAPEEAGVLREALRAAGVAATDIGMIGRHGAGVSARASGCPVAWPVFAVDEAARLLATSWATDSPAQGGPETGQSQASRPDRERIDRARADRSSPP